MTCQPIEAGRKAVQSAEQAVESILRPRGSPRRARPPFQNRRRRSPLKTQQPARREWKADRCKVSDKDVRGLYHNLMRGRFKKNRTTMKKRPRAHTRRRFSHYTGRQGIIHASQALPAVLAAFYHALVREQPELAEQFRRDPLGIQTRGDAA